VVFPGVHTGRQHSPPSLCRPAQAKGPTAPRQCPPNHKTRSILSSFPCPSLLPASDRTNHAGEALLLLEPPSVFSRPATPTTTPTPTHPRTLRLRARLRRILMRPMVLMGFCLGTLAACWGLACWRPVRLLMMERAGLLLEQWLKRGAGKRQQGL